MSLDGEAELDGPVGPDVDLHVRARRRELVRHHAPVLAAVSLGGGLGALGRYGLALLLPPESGGFPWATFLTNTLGCLLIGVLMVLITDAWTAHRLVRPFFGVGVLGGFTTFSTYAVEIRGLLHPGGVALAFTYLAGTLLAAVLAVLAGVRATRFAVKAGRSDHPGRKQP